MSGVFRSVFRDRFLTVYGDAIRARTSAGLLLYDDGSNLALSVLDGGQVVINDGSIDVDFRVEGNGDANLIYADAGNDRVGIGTATPGYKLDVNGTLRAVGNALFDALITASTTSDIGHSITRAYADGVGTFAVLRIINDHTNSGSACLLLDNDGLNEGITGLQMNFQHTGMCRPVDIECVNGQTIRVEYDMDLHTLAAANTSDIANFLPVGMLEATSFRVTTAVTTSAGTNTWSAGTAGDTDAFGAGIAGALGTTATNAHWTITGPLNNTALAVLRFSAPGAETFTAGVIRAVVKYSTMSAPTA